MKVMTAMYTLRKGGAYDRFIMMIEAFLEKGWEVHCLSLTPIRINHSFFHNHTMYFPFKTVEGLIAKLMVIFIFPLWSIWMAWNNKIHLFVAFGSLYAFVLSFSKWVLKKPMVTLIRGQFAFGLRVQNASKILLYLNKMIENVGLRFSDRIITNNTGIQAKLLKGIGKKKIVVEVLYNNIPPMNIREPEDIFQTRDKYGLPVDAKVLVTAGILNRGKNIEGLIQCLPKIEVENLYVLIGGDGSPETDSRYKDSLQGLARKLGVDKRVIFTGWLEKEDLWKIYLASDLFVMPSLSEGMPNAMLEALGCDLPCLGSDISGIRDILKYEQLIFDPQDQKTLVTKIQNFFTGRQFFDEVKSLCQERKNVLKFDWKEKVFETITHLH